LRNQCPFFIDYFYDHTRSKMSKAASVKFSAIIKKFGSKGEKTGWTYIEVSSAHAEILSPGTKTSFRVKGKLDNLAIAQVALIPMGDGNFILPLNTEMRRKGGFAQGSSLEAILYPDKEEKPISTALLLCLDDAPSAKEKFLALPKSHQRYYSNWIESAKTDNTKMKRIAKTIIGIERALSFGEIMKLDV